MKSQVSFALTLLLSAGAAIAQQSITLPGAEGPTPPDGAVPARHWSGLPFMAEEALARGYELPLPFGVGVVLTGIDDRAEIVDDRRVDPIGPSRSGER